MPHVSELVSRIQNTLWTNSVGIIEAMPKAWLEGSYDFLEEVGFFHFMMSNVGVIVEFVTLLTISRHSIIDKLVITSFKLRCMAIETWRKEGELDKEGEKKDA
jgi:predicted membrane protein